MHICIITQYFWPEHFRINDLAAGLVQRGHAVTVLTGIPNYPNGRFYSGYGFLKNRRQTYRGCEVFRLPLLPRGRSRAAELAANYLSFAASATVCSPWCTRRPIDVTLVCQLSPATVMIPAMFLSWLKGAPLVTWVLDLWPESLSATGAVHSRTLLRGIERMVSAGYRASDLVLASSKGFIPEIEKRGGSGRVRYLPNWAETIYADSRVGDAMPRPDVPNKGFRVMFAGNIGKAQGVHTIVSAAERLKHESGIHWVIVGDGRMRTWLEKEVKDRSLEATVHVLGSRPPDAMPRLFETADAMLVTLARDPVFALTAPGKIQSYLASGKVVVGALEGEGERILRESGAAVLCPPDDPDALADAVIAASKMPEAVRTSMGASGRKYCGEQFGRDSLMNRVDSWLREVVENRRAAEPVPQGRARSASAQAENV